jgi:ATP-dependent Clp protease adaptor protein ClpS
MSQFDDDMPWNDDQLSFESPDLGGAGVSATKVRPKPELEEDEGLLTPWNVILLDDDHHTYEYVMRMVGKIFGHNVAGAFEVAKTVDSQGRAICLTTHKELAELKVEQVHGFGPDPLMVESVGSMSAVMEPAEAEGDDSNDSGGQELP